MRAQTVFLSSRLVRWAVKDESGAGFAMGMFLSFTMLLIGSVAIDYTNGVRTRTQLQVVADSAVLVAVKHLSEGPVVVRESAVAHASKYGPDLLSEDDVLIGTWKNGGFKLSEGRDANAVAIIARRDDKNSNPLPTQLMFLVGIDRFNISATSIASRTRGQNRVACSGGGYLAKGEIVANSSNTYRDGFCLHGEQAISLHNVNRFEQGTIVSSSDIANITGHRNNDGLSDAMRSASHTFWRAEELKDFIDKIQIEGVASGDLPSYVTAGPIYRNSINPSYNPQRGMLYFVDGNVDLRGDRLHEEVVILATGTISIQSNVELRDVVLATRGSLSVASNVRLGGSESDYCFRDIYSSYLLSLGDMSFGSNNQLRGIFMASQGNISLNSNNASTQGVYAEALGNITYNSSSDKQGCLKGYDSELDYADWSTRLVR